MSFGVFVRLFINAKKMPCKMDTFLPFFDGSDTPPDTCRSNPERGCGSNFSGPFRF